MIGRNLALQSSVSRFWQFLSNFGWLLVAIACLLIGYLTVAQRGLYYDDYFQKYVGFTTYPARAFSQLLTVTVLKPDWSTFEVWVRLLFAALTGINAFLTGYLVYRLLNSRFAALIAVWLFLMPVFAFEAVLWQAAATMYLPGTMFALLCWLAVYKSLQSGSHAYRWVAVSIICYTVALLFDDAGRFASLVFIPFLAALVRSRTEGSSKSTGYTVRLSAVMIITCLAISGIVYGLLYAQNPLIAAQYQVARGNFITDPGQLIAHVGQYWQQLQWLTFAPEGGSRWLRETFQIGLMTLSGHPKAVLLGIGTLALLVGFIIRWRDDQSLLSPLRPILVLLLGSIVWFAAAVFIPGMFLSHQVLENRVLYFPLAAAAVFVAALLLFIVRLLRHRIWMQVAALGAGAVLVLTTVCMVGYTRTFAERSVLDSTQLQSVLAAVPRLSTTDTVYFVPFQFDERIYGSQEGVSSVVYGIFELFGPARVLLRRAYDNANVQVIDALPWAITRFDNTPAHGIAEGQIKIQDQIVPIDQVIPITYRDGQTFVIDQVAITYSDGQTTVVSFPLSQSLTASGAPSIDSIQVNTPS